LRSHLKTNEILRDRHGRGNYLGGHCDVRGGLCEPLQDDPDAAAPTTCRSLSMRAAKIFSKHRR